MAPEAPAPPALRDLCTRLARQAGAILRDGYGRIHAPERKGRIDLVTEYDRRSERLLLDVLARERPGDAVLAEESGLHAGGGGGARWYLDPLDGTTNFAHNYPFFAVSIGVAWEERLVAGAVYDPVRDEMFAAARGHGATCNDLPLRVSAIDRIEDALLVTGFPYDVREHPERHLPGFEAFLVRAQGVRRDGSAALNLAYLAAGRFDGFWESRLSSWDLAAGTLIVEEAGGRVTRYDGAPLRLEEGQVLATNDRLHAPMQDILAAVARG